MPKEIVATVILNDKASMLLGLETAKGTTYETIHNSWLIALVKRNCNVLPGVPAQIKLTLSPIE